jgi:hypothetical protein
MDTYLVILRLLHIGSGVFWAGATVYLASFVIPAATRLGPDGGKFMQTLSMTNKLPMVMMVNSLLNIVSGLLLIWEFSEGFTNHWMGSTMGIIISTGGTIALIAFLIGMTVNRPAVMKIAAIGKEAALKQQPPTQEQMEQLGKLRNRLGAATRLVAWMLSITVLAMAVARYVV